MPTPLDLILGGMMGGGGMPGAGPSPSLADQLGRLQQQPSPGGEERALEESLTSLGMALSRSYQRSPKAAELIAKAMGLVQKAQQALREVPQPPSPPPQLGAPAMPGGSLPPPIPPGLV